MSWLLEKCANCNGKTSGHLFCSKSCRSSFLGESHQARDRESRPTEKPIAYRASRKTQEELPEDLSEELIFDDDISPTTPKTSEREKACDVQNESFNYENDLRIYEDCFNKTPKTT